MTVLYASDLPPRFSSVGWWRKVVLRWTGGIYKLIGLEMGIFLGLWYIGWALASQGSFNTALSRRKAWAQAFLRERS